MSFADVIGHKKQLAILRSALASERLHHGYLFIGPEGVGKRTVALALAKGIHCQNLVNDFCGTCANCARITGNNHPDVRIVGPLIDKKEISIRQIREIERDLNYRSFMGRHKIAIIDPATLMNLAAQNALLKTLEEPPQDSLIILIAASGGALLATLRSRCVPLTFAPLARQEIAVYLRSKYERTPEDAEFLAALSMGSIGAAVKLNKDDLIEQRRRWSEQLDSLHPGDYQSAMAAAEALGEDRDEALSFLRWAETWFRDLLVYSMTKDLNKLVNLDMVTQIEHQVTENTPERIRACLEKAATATADIQRNLNRRMVLESLLFSVIGER